MAKAKKRTFQWWFMIPMAVIVYVVYVVASQLSRQERSTDYVLYQEPQGFTIEYPQAWEIRKDTQVFENGDAIAFGISGSTQKKNTELTDGAQVAVSQPFTIQGNLTTWVKGNFGNQAKFSQMTLTKYPFEAVYDCTNMGCMTYYFTLINGSVYGVATFAEGLDKDKMVYENTILYMLKSLRFDTSENGALSEEDAVAQVKALPEVIDYMKRVPNGLVAVNGDDDKAYIIQVYEVKDGHTATFNWYNVDKTTGAIEKQF